MVAVVVRALLAVGVAAVACERWSFARYLPWVLRRLLVNGDHLLTDSREGGDDRLWQKSLVHYPMLNKKTMVFSHRFYRLSEQTVRRKSPY